MGDRRLVDDSKGPTHGNVFGVGYCNLLRVDIVGVLGEDTTCGYIPIAGVVYNSNRGLNTR